MIPFLLTLKYTNLMKNSAFDIVFMKLIVQNTHLISQDKVYACFVQNLETKDRRGEIGVSRAYF